MTMYASPIKEGTKPSLQFLRSQYAYLRSIFAGRNSEYQVLRRAFDGELMSSQEGATKVGTPFQDRISLTYNVLNGTVRNYMDKMSQPPRIEGVPEGFELADLELADKRTKFLEYIYDCNSMSVKLMQAAYYQSLLDKAIWHVRPAPHLPHKIRIELGVPDFYFPLTRGDDWQHPVAVFYGFRNVEMNTILKDPMKFDGSEMQISDNMEYWDPTWFVRIERTKVIVIKHDLGVIPWFETHNLPIPHRYRGQGDVDQAVGLNEYLNMLFSAFGTMISYAAAPIAVVRGTKVGGTNLPFAPGAVWELERDAQAGFLQWSGAPPSAEAQILRTLQAIEDTTGVSSAVMGREIPSGTSGNAIRSITAGFQSRLGTKQQLLGESLAKVNECIQLMAEKMFPDEPFRVIGENARAGQQLGKRTMYEVYPREFKGWYRNKIVFTPLDAASTYFQETDKFKQGLQSKYTTMKALGVQNVWDELERMKIEHEESAARANDMGLAQQGLYSPPSQGAEDNNALMDMLNELPRKDEAKDARKAVKDTQAAVLKPSATGQVSAPTTATEPVGPGNLPESEPGPVDMNDVLAKLKQARLLSGRGALLGEQILLENPADENAVRQALGPLAKRFTYAKWDPAKVLPTDAIPFNAGAKKKSSNQGDVRTIYPGGYPRSGTNQ